MTEEFYQKITPKNISQFEVSQATRDAVAFIGNVSDPENHTVLTQGNFTLVRDFLPTEQVLLPT